MSMAGEDFSILKEFCEWHKLDLNLKLMTNNIKPDEYKSDEEFRKAFDAMETAFKKLDDAEGFNSTSKIYKVNVGRYEKIFEDLGIYLENKYMEFSRLQSPGTHGYIRVI
jgi:hypothetical protein